MLGEQLPQQPQAAGTQGRSNRELLLSRLEVVPSKRRYVEATDWEDEDREEADQPQPALGRRCVPLAAARNQAEKGTIISAGGLPGA